MKAAEQSPLLVATTAGTLAFPRFIKFAEIAQDTDMENKNEFPLDIEIGKDFNFHSIFVCPISREISTPDNYPMLLKCGHVISVQSLMKINESNRKKKFKCPTCPTEQTQADAKRLHFQ